jgi:lipoprotein
VLYLEKQSDAGRVFTMVVLIGIIIFAAVIGFYACFGRRINENIGSGFGKEYMKDKWGMDE